MMSVVMVIYLCRILVSKFALIRFSSSSDFFFCLRPTGTRFRFVTTIVAFDEKNAENLVVPEAIQAIE
jgi:hypothetical protein